MANEPVTHPLEYDGKTSELYKIFSLSFLLDLLTLGIYHFWGKTRKRRYITSSFSLDHDRFEYTGYATELLIGLILAVILLGVTSIPFYFANEYLQETVKEYPLLADEAKEEKGEPRFKINVEDPFNNKFVFEFYNITDFFFQYKKEVAGLRFHDNIIDIHLTSKFKYLDYEISTSFSPRENLEIVLSFAVCILYMIYWFAYLPFVIVYASLRYRVSRTRWRGIRGHLDGSSLLYGLLGVGQTLLKIFTLGFWIPVADIITFKYKMKKLYFGDLQARFTPSYGKMIIANLASLCACLYIFLLMLVFGMVIIPWLLSFVPKTQGLIANFMNKVLVHGYLIAILVLAWICYLPRYWYRAAFFRERYNNLKLGHLGFDCTALGKDYFKLFVINDLIFIFTLGFGLPLIWQRRMKFFCQHVKVTGDLQTSLIAQAPGDKTKFGGGLGSIMNLEIGLI